MTRMVMASKCIEKAVAQMTKADGLLFGCDPEMDVFPKLHTATAYASIALERLKEATEPIVLAG